jgi:hypothetical protein
VIMNHELGESLSFAFSKVAATQDLQAVTLSCWIRDEFVENFPTVHANRRSSS